MPKKWLSGLNPDCKAFRIIKSATLITAVNLLLIPQLGHSRPDNCVSQRNPEIRVSRSQLSQLIALPPGTDGRVVRAIVGSEAYCTLESGLTYDDQEVLRLAYPMAWDEQEWIVLSFVDGKLYGYGFSLSYRN